MSTEMDEYIKSVVDTIGDHGHVVQYVGALDDRPPYAYTVGLCTRTDHPYELTVSGLSPQVSHDMLNNISVLLAQAPPYDGMEIPGFVDGGLMLRMRLVTDHRPLVMVRTVYGQDATTWQIVWPDTSGRYPRDGGFEYPDGQVLL